MTGVISIKFGLMAPHGELEKCIEFLEEGLRSIKRTPYHRILGKDFLRQTGDLAEYLIDFHKKATTKKLKLAAIYLEMIRKRLQSFPLIVNSL